MTNVTHFIVFLRRPLTLIPYTILHFRTNAWEKLNIFSSPSGSVMYATGVTCPEQSWKYFYLLVFFLFIGAGGCQIFKETSIAMFMD